MGRTPGVRVVAAGGARGATVRLRTCSSESISFECLIQTSRTETPAPIPSMTCSSRSNAGGGKSCCSAATPPSSSSLPVAVAKPTQACCRAGSSLSCCRCEGTCVVRGAHGVAVRRRPQAGKRPEIGFLDPHRGVKVGELEDVDCDQHSHTAHESHAVKTMCIGDFALLPLPLPLPCRLPLLPRRCSMPARLSSAACCCHPPAVLLLGLACE